MIVIESHQLTKTFRVTSRRPGIKNALRSIVSPHVVEVTAVDRVNFEVNQGEIVGFLGPNGAGKSTTIKMMTGILWPTSGTVRIAGLSPHKNRKEVVSKLGVVMGQRTQLYWDLRLGDSFELLRRIYKVDENAYKKSMAWFFDALELNKFIDTPVRQLSLGQRMRGEFAAAMLHSPPILFLDEPTIGLDMEAKRAIREFILRVNAENGTTIVLTTHDLEDVQRLCQRLLVMNGGKVVADGPLRAIISRLAPYRVLVIDFEMAPPLVKLEGARVVKQCGERVWIHVDDKIVPVSRVISYLSHLCPIKDLTVDAPEIESVIEQLYSRSEKLVP